MATIVALHAHPDDESISMAGTLARAVDEGHRVVVVYATGGECGEVPPGFLDDGETLGDRRAREAAASADALGVHRIAFLGYRDSGMDGEATNDDPASFWQADVEEAAGRFAEILVEESAEVCTIYDDHGNYGHPDHVQVHRVGRRATELVGTPHVLESTMNRDHITRLLAAAAEAGADADAGPDEASDRPSDEELRSIGTPEDQITTTVDVSAWLDRKRASMAAHASQIPADSFFLAMDDEQFQAAFGREWFIRRGAPVAGADDWLLPPPSQQDGR